MAPQADSVRGVVRQYDTAASDFENMLAQHGEMFSAIQDSVPVMQRAGFQQPRSSLLLPALAVLIRVRRVVVPPHPGLFSALGLLSADQAYSVSRSAYTVLGRDAVDTIAKVYDKRFGISIPEWRVIAILGRFPGLSAVEVAERTMMDKVAVSRAVAKLIKNGRIHREFADADRRRSPPSRPHRRYRDRPASR